uniref:SRPBCC family protein n=1 Tax=Pseudonocardia lacus TaxID=2835865 RepID=UPI001BDCE6F4
MGLYVETRIRADVDTVWRRTQDPAAHQSWDLRFTRIEPLASGPGQARRFRYAVRVLPGLTVSGSGVHAGERHRPDGTRTSALRFASDHPLSLIAEGSGYWRYVPDAGGVRFLTGYDYAPRWGRVGGLVDRFAFRPLMGWGTAWSFDRLRLWCERGIAPRRSLRNALLDVGLRVGAVLAAARVRPALAVVVGALAVAAPPAPARPSARRC